MQLRFLEQGLDLDPDHVKSHIVETAVDNNVRVILGGLDEDIMHRFDCGQVLLGNSFHVSRGQGFLQR